jgi:hypothetical protein
MCGRGVHADTRRRLYRIICSSGILHKHPPSDWNLPIPSEQPSKAQLGTRDFWDVDVAFLNAVPALPSYVEWPKVILEFDFLNKEETSIIHQSHALMFLYNG